EQNRRRERRRQERGHGHVAPDRNRGEEQDDEQRRADGCEPEQHAEGRRDPLPALESEETGIEVAEERREPDYRDGGARKAEALRDQHGHEPFQRVPEERQEARGRAGGAG